MREVKCNFEIDFIAFLCRLDRFKAMWEIIYSNKIIHFVKHSYTINKNDCVMREVKRIFETVLFHLFVG
jgi:hypothetical protein